MNSKRLLRGFALSAFIAASTIPSSAQIANDNAPATDKKTLESQIPFILNGLKFISENHVDADKTTDGRKMAIDALNGVLKGLDPHSHYFSTEEFKAFRESMSGQFTGIGTEITQEGPFIKVVAPIEDSPAWKAGIKAGDIITHVNGESLRGFSTDSAAKKMRGAPKTPARLTILRKGETKPLEITVIRDRIVNQPVKSANIGNDIGYARLSHFSYEKTDADGGTLRDARGKPVEDGITLIQKALLKMKAEMGPNAKGYILDLRNDPGGLVTQAVSLSDHFLDAGKVVYTMRGRDPAQSKPYTTEIPGDIIDGKPLIVLVNEGSASASELVAGALQDHKRATVMGVPTFGKGSVQIIRPLTNGEAIKLTIAQYFTPDDRSIQGRGITPDVLFKPLVKDEMAAYRTREADLEGSLANIKSDTDKDRTKSVCSPQSVETPVAGLEAALVDQRTGKADDMLLCAVEHLRGRSVLTRTAPVPR